MEFRRINCQMAKFSSWMVADLILLTRAGPPLRVQTTRTRIRTVTPSPLSLAPASDQHSGALSPSWLPNLLRPNLEANKSLRADKPQSKMLTMRSTLLVLTSLSKVVSSSSRYIHTSRDLLFRKLIQACQIVIITGFCRAVFHSRH